MSSSYTHYATYYVGPPTILPFKKKGEKKVIKWVPKMRKNAWSSKMMV
jgi:hypothetical protein